MNPKPATTRQGIASQSTWLNEKAISPTPNSPLAMAMMRPRPMTDRRPASQSAPSSAPQPDEVISMPSVCGPPWKTVVEDRHQHRVRDADEAHDGEEQDNRANRAEAKGIGK